MGNMSVLQGQYLNSIWAGLFLLQEGWGSDSGTQHYLTIIEPISVKRGGNIEYVMLYKIKYYLVHHTWWYHWNMDDIYVPVSIALWISVLCNIWKTRTSALSDLKHEVMAECLD